MMATKIIAVTLCTLGNLLVYMIIGTTSKDLFDVGMIFISFEIVLFLISLVIFAA